MGLFFQECRDDWATISWIYLDSKKLTADIDKFLSQFKKLPNTIRNLPLAKEIYKNMKNFKFSVSIMVELKNEALKERHWQEIMLKTGIGNLTVLFKKKMMCIVTTLKNLDFQFVL